MTLFQALVLGLLQGLTEFLPISSSGHGVLIPALLGWDIPPAEFEVLLHTGTIVAVLIYFFREFIEALDGLGRPSPGRTFVGLLAIGTVPAAVIGGIFEATFEGFFSRPDQVAAFLVVTGLILAATETYARHSQRDESVEQTQLSVVEKIALEVTWWKALAIGFAQALAIFPGISRSGSTIGTGLLVGLSRPQAARFSFMLAVPILIGTSIVQLPELGRFNIGWGPIIVGAAASLVSSYLAIAGMIGYLQRRGLYPFAAYCLVVGAVAVIFLSRV